MGKGKWASKDKLRIVLEGMKGKVNISQLCSHYGISQTLYYRWRDQLLEHGAEVFESKQRNKKEAKLEQENKKLKQIVGELTIELKKPIDSKAAAF